MLNLTEIKAACERATKGPWRHSKLDYRKSAQIVGPLDELICEIHWHPTSDDNNAAVIFNSRQWVPELVAAYETAMTEIEWLKTQLGIYKAQLKMRDEESQNG